MIDKLNQAKRGKKIEEKEKKQGFSNSCVDLPELAIVGSRPRAEGTAMAALKFSTLSAVLKLAI